MSDRIRACGQEALLVECGGLAESAALATCLRGATGAVDVVPAARTVLVICDGPGALPALRRAVESVLRARPGEGAARAGRTVTLDVEYDGKDLDDVARLAGLTPRELVEAHTAIRWRAAFGGFTPGFLYLVEEPVLLGTGPGLLPAVPRLDTPRTAVPAGAVALADRWCGVYPDRSPGGWRLIGRTCAELWREDREPPALLRPGDTVLFRETALLRRCRP